MFGCNNLNGSPKGNVTVRVWRTVEGKLDGVTNPRTPKDDDTGCADKTSGTHSYDVAAVYGGGNLANYEATGTGKKAHVVIETCEVSIETVYGGGNAAEVPGTDVLVKGAYEINEVFGGGNGSDPYTTDGGTTWVDNPGANIGNALQGGNASTLMTGGLIHAAYGGSNKKGTIFGSVSIDIGEGDEYHCDLDLEKMVGAGKDADVNGDLIMVLGCKPNTKIPVVYGGADNAHVNGDIELTITSGIYEEVYGGNNAGGYVFGHIKLNIEERDCTTPIWIDHLYLGGKQAAYSMYGYYNAGAEDAPNPQPRTAAMADPTDANHYKETLTKINGVDVRRHPDATTHSYAKPELNIISCTYIGEVYGGGYGSNATIYGDPIVNINMVPGPNAADNIDRDGNGTADGLAHGLGKIGDVYGGGNQAAVEGSTTVNIGTATTVEMTSLPKVRAVEGDPEYDANKTADEQPMVYQKETVEGAYITGDVYGGGNEANVTGNTYVNVCAYKDYNTTADVIEYKGVTISGTDFEGVRIGGNVFGGGKGVTDHFECKKAMVGVNNESDDPQKRDGGTHVIIGNGTVGTLDIDGKLVDGTGNVYGGGQLGRVERNTMVTIGLGDGTEGGEKTPIIYGCVFGAGSGVNTHGYAALVRGNSTVTIQGNAWVQKSVYGGGETATVGKYTVDATTGLPTSPVRGGLCTVSVKGWAEIGPDNMQMKKVGGPDDTGYVFGACKGVLPYEGYSDSQRPQHMDGSDIDNDGVWEDSPKEYKAFDELTLDNNNVLEVEDDYMAFINTLALATTTKVTIGEHAFIKGAVYGGSENGHVQGNTHVTIEGDCQIGNGEDVNRRYTSDEWAYDGSSADKSLKECASWDYGKKIGTDTDGKDIMEYLPYDVYKDSDSDGTPDYASDGHTFYGNVFGGGSGYFPYHRNHSTAIAALQAKDEGYADGLWHREAGSVGGNTVVDITGGHILTSVYGGNECTDVAGSCTINMVGGTVGVPRTVEQAKAHPVTCYVFGAGKGDQRINFNKWTNVASTQLNISGSARIYGSTFGGGEDGHVVGNVETNIGGSFNMKINNVVTPVTYSNVRIGTTGTSGVDGNIFGGGRGFSETALTAGVVGGDVAVNIHNGTILGTVFGGGRLASVGTHFADAESADYGTMQNTITPATYYTSEEIEAAVEGDDAYGKTTSDIKTPESIHGKITVTIDGGTIGATDSDGKLAMSDFSIGDVFGGCKGSPNDVRFGMSKNTFVNISGANTKINGNVYGGGEAGDVGTITRNTETYNYTWKNSDGDGNTAENNKITPTDNKNSGICTVTITGGTIGDGGKTSTKGNVFGAGKGVANTFWCEKAMVYATKVSISGTTKVNGNVYGGGEVGRVEDDAKVEINTSGGSNDEPDIKGNVYGAGAGLETHGYSALVRGNSIVTIKGNTKVGGSVFGGGETASLGRFVLDANKLPKEPDGGGESTVTITDNAKIGLSGTDHDVYGAGQGVEPNWVYREYTADTEQTPYDTRITNSKRMMTYTSTKHLTGTRYKEWDYYSYPENHPDYHKYVWEYYPTEAAYLEYLKTLAIASHPIVTIAENATVYGDVYGGGQRGITLGDVAVNIAGGTVKQDVYGGGSLADTNKGNWDDSQYSAVTLPVGHALTDLYTRTGGLGTAEDPYTYSEATDAAVVDGKTYYSKGTWATGKYNESTHATTYKTNVTLTGGEIEGDVYGGGLGQIKREAVAAQPALSAVKAKVYGDVLVKLNEDTSNDKCKVHGNIFGCNNQNGSPQSAVTVHVYKTEGWEGHMRTGKELTGSALTEALNNPDDSHHSYELMGVYGGGNLSAFYPDLKATRDTVQAYVIIDGCKQTSIKQVYGGGNAAPTPATNITIFATYEIEEVFGGGNGKDDLPDGSPNPGANVGYETYPDEYDIPKSSKTERTSMFSYGSGSASVTIYDGLIHRVFGGSNNKGNVRESAVTLLDDMSGCDFQIDEAYGGGKNAPMDAEAKLLMACIPGLKAAYGGAQEADVLGGVNLTITNGTYERIFGGNNISGTIQGPIVVNIEETGCRPIVIGELYGGGNLAGYSVYGYKEVTEGEGSDAKKLLKPRESATDVGNGPAKPYPDPQVNVKSFTSIGNIFGGGYGESAVMVGNPTVNINVVKGKYAETYNGSDNEIGDNARIIGSSWTTVTSAPGYDNGYPIPSHVKGAIGAINNVFGGGNAAEVKGTPHVNIGTLTGESITLVTKSIEDSEGKAPSENGWTPSYQMVTVEGVDIRGNVYGGGNEADVTGDTEVVIGKNNNVKTYCFTSYSAASDGTAWSSGLAQTTGVTKKISDTDYSEVVILTNGKYGDYVGKKYYVDPTIKTDGSERKQLMDDENHETGMWVAIKPFEHKKTYTFTSYSAKSEGNQYSEGTAAATGNFKVISIESVATDCMQIVVLTNPGETSWVGKTFYVPVDASTDGTTRTQLYDADGSPVGVWVTIK